MGVLATEHFIPGSRHLSPRKRRRLLIAVAAALVVGALGGLLADFVIEVGTAKPRIRAEQDAEKELDSEEDPLVSAIDYDQTAPVNLKIVLDRRLTKAEQEKLKSLPFTQQRYGGDVWNLLRPLGGRMIRYPASMLNPPPGFDATNWDRSDATIFKMNLFSDRTSMLSITGMTPVNLSCRPSTAKAVVEIPPQGIEVYSNIAFDLTAHGSGPLIVEEGEEQGQPFFSRRKIDLGGAMSPGGLRVEAMVREKSCRWEIKAQYRDASQKSDTVILRDGKKPFFAEALPVDPEQHWITETDGPASLIPCHEEPEQIVCRARK
ncbi:hypothetical protein ACWGJ0_23545 [Streptomyces massasporeus]